MLVCFLPKCRHRAVNPHTWQSEQRIRLCRHPNADQCSLRLVEYFRFPVVYVVLLGNRKVRLNAAYGIKEFDFRTSLNKAVGNF